MEYNTSTTLSQSESKDCAVRAIATALDISYEEAHEACKQSGRKDNKGTSVTIIHRTLSLFKSKFQVSDILYTERKPRIFTRVRDYGYGEVETQVYRTFRPTQNQFIAENKVGIFVVWTDNHCYTIIDGVVHDWHILKNKKRRNIQGYIKVEKL